MLAQILIVDAQPDAREILKLWVELFGYEVVEAGTGEEAIENAITNRPRLIITELELPGMDGIETIRRLKSDPRTADIPVVVHTILNHEQRATGLGIKAFLTKPAAPEKLKETISGILGAKP